MQPTNHRPSGEADESTEKDSLDSAFEPGDSFSNDPSEQGDAGELPAWLQNFADVASEQSGGQPAQSSPPESSPAMTQPLSAAAPDAEPFDVQAGGGPNFFSDDDLPEWLRALSTDGDPSAGIEQRVAAPASGTSANGTLEVPAVSRAWVTPNDQPEVSPGANLLASLVHVIDSRPDAVAPQPAVASAPVPSQPAVSQPRPQATEVATSDAPAAAPGWGRLRLVAIVAIVLIVLLIIIMILGN